MTNNLSVVKLSKKPDTNLVKGSYTSHTKTACIKTFGCQMNVHDSDRMRRMVMDAGYAEVQSYEEADLVILNTCYVRENAVDRVRGHLGELNRLRQRRPRKESRPSPAAWEPRPNPKNCNAPTI